jgi:hypothetical protein
LEHTTGRLWILRQEAGFLWDVHPSGANLSRECLHVKYLDDTVLTGQILFTSGRKLLSVAGVADFIVVLVEQKNQLHTMNKPTLRNPFPVKRILLLAGLIAMLTPGGLFANDIYPSIFTDPYGAYGGSGYCQGATSTNQLYINWSNAMCGSGPTYNVPITITWYYTTNGTNTGGTQVSVLNTNSSVTSASCTPTTTVAPGTYYYYVVISWNTGNCAPAGSLTSSTSYGYDIVTIYPKPTALLSASANPICSGSSIILTAGETGGYGGQYNYTWQATSSAPFNTYSSNATSFTVSVSPTSNDTYTLTVTDNSTNCIGTAVLTVSVNPKPIASLSAAPSTICTGSTSTLTASQSGGVQPFYYTWTATSNPPADYNNTIASSYTTPVTPTVTTTYTLTVTDHNNCTGTAVTTVSVNPLPTITATASPSAAVCLGNSVTLTASGAISYTWSNGVSNGVAFMPTASATCIVTGTDGNGCSNSTSKAITVNSLPTVTANATATVICSGASVTLTGGGASSYTWTSGVSDGVAFIPTTTATYTVTGTDGNGCTNTASKTITLNPLPAITINATSTVVCAGMNVTLSGNGANTYTWTNGISNGVAFTPSSTQTYTVTGTDANSCSNSASQMVVVNPLPSVTANATHTVVCYGSPVVFTGGGASTYTWSSGVTDGVAYVVTSSQTFTVTGTDANSCSNTATIGVSALTPPTPDICMVTVDSLSQYNIIYWDKTSYTSADTFLIYRDTANNNYALVGRVSRDSLSMCIDTARHIGAVNGDPNVGTYRYKLAVKDTCGNVGAMSPYHNTVYSIDLGTGTFTYNQYGIEGQPTPVPGLSQYVLKRDNFNTGNYVVAATIGASSTSINDPNYATYQLTANWYVQTNWTTICTPTMRAGNNGTQTTVVRSRSNVRNNRTTGVKQNDHKLITIYPNPASDELTVLINGCDHCKVEIINALGESVKDVPVSGLESKISLSDMINGIYFVKVTGNGQVQKLEKLIVQH